MSINGRMLHQDFRDDYVVYEVLYNNDLVYVGSGKWGRQFHTVSGVSHSYELNKLHFTDPLNVTLSVIKDGMTKEDSLTLEKYIIRTKKPTFNIRWANEKLIGVEKVLNMTKVKRLQQPRRDILKSFTKQLLTFYSIDELCGGFPLKVVGMREPIRIKTFDNHSTVKGFLDGKYGLFEQYANQGIVFCRIKEEHHLELGCSSPKVCLHAHHIGLSYSEIQNKVRADT